uniref:Uncharacterized protein n=1 Tax=Plectus sambesii TaxID=2011161 RepID=A0A914XCV7_9BILA
MGVFSVLIYGIIFGTWAVALGYDVLFMPRLYKEWWAAKLCFMTMINFVLQTVYFGLCFIRAIVDAWHETKDKGPHRRHPGLPTYWPNSKLHRVCDFIYATSAFPLGFATVFLFWSLYLIEPTLVIPKWAEHIIPKWHNHMTHTAPVPFLLVDTLLMCHHMPPRKTGSIVAIALVVFYFGIIGAVKIFDGFWLYPVFDMLTPFQRGLLMIGGGFVFWLLYILGDLLNGMLWGRASHAMTTEVKKVK